MKFCISISVLSVALDCASHVLQAKGVSKLGVGRHVMCRAEINDERVVRDPDWLLVGRGSNETVEMEFESA